MAGKSRAIGDLQPAAPGKYIDFLDLGRLQLQRLRIAAPCGAHRPCFCNRTDDNPVSADKIGYISIISCNINILHRMLCRSEEHTSELQSLMRISYAVFCLKKKNK